MLASEGSDWAKEVSDWPSAVAVPPSSTGTSDFSGQKLETVLEKLGFFEYLPLFKVGICNIYAVGPLNNGCYLTLIDCVEKRD